MPDMHTLVHPEYDASISDWERYRLTYEGGRPFIEKYLVKYTLREDQTEFNERTEMSYCPALAKAAINDIKNAIYQRMPDIVRKDGPQSYLDAADAKDEKGVDLSGNSMNSYIGRILLPDLLIMSKVGVYVDRPDVEIITRQDQKDTRPYLYHYQAEDIRSWAYDSENILSVVLLQDHEYENDTNGLPIGEYDRFRYVWREDGVVKTQFFDADGEPIDKTGEAGEAIYITNIPQIPFVIFNITSSLLTDASDYQIASLNLASSDMHYALKSNFPFYTEMYNAAAEIDYLMDGSQTQGELEPGTSTEANIAKGKVRKVGTTKGVRYGKGMERPGFINPSSEPLEASMKKQEVLKQEIRQVVNLNVTNIDPRKASADSKAMDERGLEAGLSYIGMELEYGERRIAALWAMYEATTMTTIKYPEKYSLKSDSDRLTEADTLEDAATMSPSITMKKAIAIQAAILRIGSKVTSDEMDMIIKEIRESEYIVFDSDILDMDQENGRVSAETASLIRGYAIAEYPKAKEAHIERLAAIAAAQSSAPTDGGARGLTDQSTDSKDSKNEKRVANNNDNEGTPNDSTRSKGRRRKR